MHCAKKLNPDSVRSLTFSFMCLTFNKLWHIQSRRLTGHLPLMIKRSTNWGTLNYFIITCIFSLIWYILYMYIFMFTWQSVSTRLYMILERFQTSCLIFFVHHDQLRPSYVIVINELKLVSCLRNCKIGP